LLHRGQANRSIASISPTLAICTRAIFTDVDPTYIVAVNPANGTVYRFHGFTDSLTEFEKLMAATKVKVSSLDQAEAVADFYREINPERRSITQISGLLELKQAAERQCQAVPFDPNEKDFETWWKHAKPLYSGGFVQANGSS
jgi:hypothetical protein